MCAVMFLAYKHKIQHFKMLHLILILAWLAGAGCNIQIDVSIEVANTLNDTQFTNRLLAQMANGTVSQLNDSSPIMCIPGLYCIMDGVYVYYQDTGSSMWQPVYVIYILLCIVCLGVLGYLTYLCSRKKKAKLAIRVDIDWPQPYSTAERYYSEFPSAFACTRNASHASVFKDRLFTR